MTSDSYCVALRIVAVILPVLVASLVGAQDQNAERSAADFNMAAYLEQLSAKGKENGYREVVYKRGPHTHCGHLRRTS